MYNRSSTPCIKGYGHWTYRILCNRLRSLKRIGHISPSLNYSFWIHLINLDISVVDFRKVISTWGVYRYPRVFTMVHEQWISDTIFFYHKSLWQCSGYVERAFLDTQQHINQHSRQTWKESLMGVRDGHTDKCHLSSAPWKVDLLCLLFSWFFVVFILISASCHIFHSVCNSVARRTCRYKFDVVSVGNQAPDRFTCTWKLAHKALSLGYVHSCSVLVMWLPLY